MGTSDLRFVHVKALVLVVSAANQKCWIEISTLHVSKLELGLEKHCSSIRSGYEKLAMPTVLHIIKMIQRNQLDAGHFYLSSHLWTTEKTSSTTWYCYFQIFFSFSSFFSRKVQKQIPPWS